MENKDCIFCKIVKGEIPSAKVYEDENTIAFLDINPATKHGGHTLVLPKQHYENIVDVPETVLNEIMSTVKKVAKALMKFAGAVNILQNNGKAAGQAIWHIHFHVIPRFPNDNIKINYWEPQKYTNHKMEEIRSKITKLIANE